MKKIVSIILAFVTVVAAMALVSCTGKQTDAETETEAEIVVPDVTLTYQPADIYADEATAEANGLKTADSGNLSTWFKEKQEFDPDTYEILPPEEFKSIESYAMRIAQGQRIEEVTVLKVSDEAAVDAVKAIAEYRLNKKKNNNDYKLYDEDGINAKMIDTGKVVVIGKFVVYAVTENTEVSILRAQKFAKANPDASAYELYKAIVIEEK